MRFSISNTRFFISRMLLTTRPLLTHTLLLFLLAVFPVASHAEVNLGAYPDRGYPAPEFTLYDLQGKKHSLSDYKGKVVMLNVWATWCYPCLVEMPAMESLYKKMKSDKFDMIAVNIDQTGSSVVRDVVKSNQYTFPVLLSPDGFFQSLYMAQAIPTTFIINKAGTIVSRVPGAREWDSPEAIKAIRKLIGE